MRPITFLVFAAAAFGLGSTFLAGVIPIPSAILASGVVCGFGLLAFTFGKSKGTTFGLLGAVVPVALVLGAVNVLVSERSLFSTAKILGWIAVVVIARDLARHSTAAEYERVRRWVPWMLGGVGWLLLLQGVDDPDVMLGRRHMAATYLGLAMTAGLFSPRLLWRAFWVVVGVAGIYFSASRGAMLSLPMALVGYGIYLVLSKQAKDAAAMLALAGAICVVFLVPSLRDSFFDQKKRSYSSGYESLEAGLEGRIFLTEEAWNIAVANPLGTGAGRTYGITVGQKQLGAHNGYLDTLAQLGFPTTLLLFGWYALLVLRVARNPGFPLRAKGMFMTFVAVLHVRALGESYSVFDSASFYVLLLWYMTWYGAYEARQIQPVPAGRAPRFTGQVGRAPAAGMVRSSGPVPGAVRTPLRRWNPAVGGASRGPMRRPGRQLQ